MADLPTTMRASVIEGFGGPEALVLRELPVPRIDEMEVLIALHAAGVGTWDADVRDGWYPYGPPPFPLVLGTDGAGTVVRVGSEVRRFSVGDRVWSYSWNNPKGGFYAEYVAVVHPRVALVPAALDLVHAGGAATTALTALQGLDDQLGVAPDQVVIVHGASGGVGTLAVQLAKRRGARVVAVASGADGALLARRLGADVAIDGKQDDVVAATRTLAPRGADAVLALVGDGLEGSLDALRRGGVVAYPRGVDPEPIPRSGVEVRAYDAVAGIPELERLDQAVEEAELEVPLAGQFPLEEAARAHERLAQGHVLGKLVLRIR